MTLDSARLCSYAGTCGMRGCATGEAKVFDHDTDDFAKPAYYSTDNRPPPQECQ